MNYIIIAILIALSAFFSATETALSSVNRIRLKSEAANGNKKSAKALKAAENFEKSLTTILVGNNIVNILSATIGVILFTDLFGETYGAIASTVIITILVLTFGEIIPKTFAKRNAEKIAVSFAGALGFISLALTPASAIFTFIQRSFIKLSGAEAAEKISVTEDELKYIIEEIEDQGVLEEKESDLVRSALEFDEITVEKIMVPRVKVTAVEKNDDIDKIMRLFVDERYSRMPVYEKTVDNITGIIHEKDFFALITLSSERPESIESIIQKTIYVSETKLISEVLYEMQKNKMHMAIVKDQYGGTSGIVTLEDVLEELVGEIYDENDEIIPPITKISENSYEALSELGISDTLEFLELPDDIIESESNTLSGWTMELFGRIPEQGSIVREGIFTVTVLDSDEKNVRKIKIEIDRPQT